MKGMGVPARMAETPSKSTGLPTTKQALLDRIQGCVGELTQVLHAGLVEAEKAQGPRAVVLRRNAQITVLSWQKAIEEAGGDEAARRYLKSVPEALRRCFHAQGCAAFSQCVVKAQFGVELVRRGEYWTLSAPGSGARDGAGGVLADVPSSPSDPFKGSADPVVRVSADREAADREADWENPIPGLPVPRPSPETIAAAKPLLDRVIRVRGGLARMASLATARAEQSLTYYQPGSIRGRLMVTSTFRAPNWLHQRAAGFGDDLVLCVMGDKGVRVRGPDSVALSEEEIAQILASLERDIDVLFLRSKDSGVVIHRLPDFAGSGPGSELWDPPRVVAMPRALGRAGEDLKPAQGAAKGSPRLAVTQGRRLLSVLTLDPRTHTIVSRLYRSHVEMLGMSTVEVRYGSFRRQDGDLVPHVVRMLVGGKVHLSVSLGKYQRNTKVDDALFTCGGRLKPPPR